MEIESILKAAGFIAIAAAFANILGPRLKIPIPLLLLGFGLLIGLDDTWGLDVHKLGHVFEVIIVLAVGLIVFEGGFAIRFSSLRNVGPIVRNLVLLGLLVTTIFAMFVANVVLGWEIRLAIIFGALITVTGPSVITPLLRSIKVNDRIRTVLSSEGVIIDPFGALLVLVLIQVVVTDAVEVDQGIRNLWPVGFIASRIIIGLVVGLLVGALTYFVTRIVPNIKGLEVLLLIIGAAVGAFAISENLASESGLVAMVVMSLVVGNAAIPHREAFNEGQESISAWLVAIVYVLLAASIDIDSIAGLWPKGFIVVAIVVFVGRPLLVAIATLRSDLGFRERFFLAFVAPRGIVAASLATVAASQLSGRLEHADQLAALVFLVVALTIGIQSVYAGFLARVLKVQPMSIVIAGAGEVGLRAASILKAAGEPVVLIESDEKVAATVEEAGYTVVIGDASEARTLRSAGVEDAKALLIATPNDPVNLLAAQVTRSQLDCANVYVRVNEPKNVEVFQEVGAIPISQTEAVATELAYMVTDPGIFDVLAQVEEDVTVIRVAVTDINAQRPISSNQALLGTLIVLVTRGQSSFIPNGSTELRVGDVVTIFGKHNELASARAALSAGAG